MKMTRTQEDVVTEVLTKPGVNILDLLHIVKRHGYTYKDSREAILTLMRDRVILEGYPEGGMYFNRNQGKVYRGIT
jgi:hypothetical protein